MPLTTIDRVGTFRGTPQEWAVNTSTNGFPQFVCRFMATEFYDSENEVWMPWTEYGMEITAYLVLFGNKGPCLNHTQVQKALGWDGASFAALDSADWSTAVVQFRVEDHEYQGQTKKQVSWIDAHDAEPGTSIKKLDSKGLKDLDAKFKAAKPAATAPASAAPKGKPATPPKPPATPAAAKDPTPDANDVPESPPSDAPSEPPAAPKKGKKGKKDAEVDSTGLAKACSKTEAWAKVAELKLDEVTDDQLNEAWLESCGEILGEEGNEDDLTQSQWAAIRDKTLDRIPHCPF